MRRWKFALLLAALYTLPADRPVFSEGPTDGGLRLGATVQQQWKIGLVVSADSGSARGITATTPVPMDWPEQKVKIIEEDVSSNVDRMTYRTIGGGVKQMVVSIPRLRAGQAARAVVSFAITKRLIEEPETESSWQLPGRSNRQLRQFLLPSPYIDSQDPRIRELAENLSARQAGAWQRVRGIYDWVRANVRYEFSPHIKSSTAALTDGVGDCEEMTSLFVALCRASQIPARAVWVPSHCYPEFYLVGPDGKGVWIPCQAAGQRAFGGIAEVRPILQKGDNFRLPGQSGAVRYVNPTLSARDATAALKFQWILEQIK